MKHFCSSIASALLLCAGFAGFSAAHAQSQGNVSLYGIVDTGVERLNHASGGGSITRMPSISGSVASRWGLRGNEDLGSGLKAMFTLESGFGADTGALQQGGRGFGRQAFVGLGGNWGAVTLGRQYSMLFQGAANTDLFLAQIYGAGVFDAYLGAPRLDNAIAYLGTFGSVTAGALYSLGRDATNCAGETSGSACRAWSAVLKYDAPAWGVAAWVDQQRGSAAQNNAKNQYSAIDGYVMFGSAKLAANYLQNKSDVRALTNPALRKSTLWSLAVAYPLTPAITLEGMYYTYGYKDLNNGTSNLLALRGAYAFSKRTAAYITLGYMRNDASNNFSATIDSLTDATLRPVAGQNQTGVMVGLRHTF